MSGWLDRPRGLFTHGEWIVLLALVVVGAFQVFVLGRCGRDIERLPQLVRGDDALAVAFGGARETISLAMVHKADSYFHGGIDMECTLDHDHDESCTHDHDESSAHDHEHGEASTHDHSAESNNFRDPWAWINRHVRAPEVERHLESGKVVEMLPWLWASVRADPHNIEAWTTAWYTANNLMRDQELALRILAEGRRCNPDDFELMFYEGRTFYRRGGGDVAAARAAFMAAEAKAMAKCGGRTEELSEHERQVLEFTRNYLKEIARKGMLP